MMKSELRKPKAEPEPKAEGQQSAGVSGTFGAVFRFSVLGFGSAFGFRFSGF
jgi:hypothetical protein